MTEGREPEPPLLKMKMCRIAVTLPTVPLLLVSHLGETLTRGARMKFTTFLNKVSTEEVTIEAETKSEAEAQLQKLIEERTGASSAVLRFALIEAKGDTDFGYGVRLRQKEGLTAAHLPKPTGKAIHA